MKKTVAIPLATLLVAMLSGCAVSPSGPSVMALPGSGKSWDQFRLDDSECRSWAQSQIGGGGADQAATDATLRSVAVGTAVGALAGAAMGGLPIHEHGDHVRGERHQERHRHRHVEEQPEFCPGLEAQVFPQVGELLLARSPHYVPGVYSALAGFVEAGESLEDCVHREVAEEYAFLLWRAGIDK
ncbi:MAG: hypothetical protein RL468_2148 [Pseudomonadota bacterium]